MTTMRYLTLLTLGAVFFISSVGLIGQEPTTAGSEAPPDSSIMSASAIKGSKQDPAAVERGGKVFRASCAGCHGVAAGGGAGAPDLVRSVLVLDDEKGILIAPVIREGRPERGMPKLGLSEAQIADVVAWLHARTYAAGHRGTYVFQNIVTGNPQLGKRYFDSARNCAQCHSVTGDLAGIGKKYDALTLQSLWLEPSDRRARKQDSSNASKMQPTVTVTVNGKTIEGTLEQFDDFTVGLQDVRHQYHSFNRGEKGISVQVHDPLEAHAKLLHKYTDADIHNVTAYLASLK